MDGAVHATFPCACHLSHAVILLLRILITSTLYLVVQAVQDFLQALQLDPDNAELTKLLTTAREKHREVEGISAAVEEEEEEVEDVEVQEVSAPRKTFGVVEELLVEHKQGVEWLQLPPSGAALLKMGSLSVVAHSASMEQHPSSNSSGTFVRINVVSDDEDEEEDEDEDQGEEVEEEEGTRDTAATTSFNRIAITDEDESDEEEEEESSSQTTEEKAAELKERGNVFLKQGDAAGAVDAYTQSLALLPTYLPSLNNRAQAYLTLKVCEEVFQTY